MKTLTMLAALALVVVSGCGGDAERSTGTWRLVSLSVDGDSVPIEQPLFMDIADDGFRASTTCNTVSGDFGGDIETTAMLCGGDEAMTNERYMSQAFRSEPTRNGDQLVF
ncbi:MAG: hypothetical protein WKF60_14045, partial [Ilumatobacter sp.]